MTRGAPQLLFFLATRFFSLRRSSAEENSSFLVWISRVSLGGVALGVAALVVVTSVVNGFEEDISKAVIGLHGQALLYSRGEPLDHSSPLLSRLQTEWKNTLSAVSPAFVLEGMLSGPQGAYGAIINGVDFPSFFQVTTLAAHLKEGRFPEPPFELFGQRSDSHEVVLGQDLAHKLGVQRGDVLRLMVPLSSIPTQTLEVVGIVHFGMYDYDSQFVWMALPDMQTLLNQPGKVTHFYFRFRNESAAQHFAKTLSEELPYPYRVKHWSQLNQNLLYAIQLEKFVIALLLLIILIVAAFNIVSTLMILIHEKAPEVAALKSMGLSASRIFWLFSGIGISLGGLGVCLGLGLALGLLEVLRRTQWIPLSASVYSLSYLPVVLRPQEIALITLGAWCLCWMATWYPAYYIAHQPLLGGFEKE